MSKFHDTTTKWTTQFHAKYKCDEYFYLDWDHDWIILSFFAMSKRKIINTVCLFVQSPFWVLANHRPGSKSYIDRMNQYMYFGRTSLHNMNTDHIRVMSQEHHGVFGHRQFNCLLNSLTASWLLQRKFQNSSLLALVQERKKHIHAVTSSWVYPPNMWPWGLIVHQTPLTC